MNIVGFSYAVWVFHKSLALAQHAEGKCVLCSAHNLIMTFWALPLLGLVAIYCLVVWCMRPVKRLLRKGRLHGMVFSISGELPRCKHHPTLM